VFYNNTSFSNKPTISTSHEKEQTICRRKSNAEQQSNVFSEKVSKIFFNQIITNLVCIFL